MAEQHLAQRGEDVAHLLGRRLVAKLEHGAQQPLIPQGEVVELDLGELGIRHGDDGPFQRADAGGDQPDRLHRADMVPISAEVADLDRLVDEQDQAADQVREGALRGERHGQTADAEAGQEWDQVSAQMANAPEEDAGRQQEPRDPRNDPQHRGIARAVLDRTHGDDGCRSRLTERVGRPGDHGQDDHGRRPRDESQHRARDIDALVDEQAEDVHRHRHKEGRQGREPGAEHTPARSHSPENKEDHVGCGGPYQDREQQTDPLPEGLAAIQGLQPIRQAADHLPESARAWDQFSRRRDIMVVEARRQPGRTVLQLDRAGLNQPVREIHGLCIVIRETADGCGTEQELALPIPVRHLDHVDGGVRVSPAQRIIARPQGQSLAAPGRLHHLRIRDGIERGERHPIEDLLQLQGGLDAEIGAQRVRHLAQIERQCRPLQETVDRCLDGQKFVSGQVVCGLGVRDQRMGTIDAVQEPLERRQRG